MRGMPTSSGMQVIHLGEAVMLASGRVPAKSGHLLACPLALVSPEKTLP